MSSILIVIDILKFNLKRKGTYKTKILSSHIAVHIDVDQVIFVAL